MKAVFWGIFVVYQVVSVIGNWRGSDNAPAERVKRLTALQFPLLMIACWISVRDGVLGRSLASPLFIAAGIVLGYCVHAASLVITNLPAPPGVLLRDLATYISKGRDRWYYFVESPSIMIMLVSNSIIEEVIYRAVAQRLLIEATGQPMLGIAAVAVLFALAHSHFLRGHLLETMEFMAYSVALGALYYATGSLVFVIVIHTVRNFELYFQAFFHACEENDSREAALEAVNNNPPHASGHGDNRLSEQS
ncbi:MAG: CPBP family intramembrane glutamic endopeptidase [Candidatus Hydrogenedentota bacterium]